LLKYHSFSDLSQSEDKKKPSVKKGFLVLTE
jgi:hypothetical protein